MITTECILIKGTGVVDDSGNPLPSGTYLNPDSPLIERLQPAEYEDQCSLHPIVSVVFFLSFVMLSGLIIINLVVGAILENMAMSSTDVLLPVTKDNIEDFAAAWSQIDPHATGQAAYTLVDCFDVNGLANLLKTKNVNNISISILTGYVQYQCWQESPDTMYV